MLLFPLRLRSLSRCLLLGGERKHASYSANGLLSSFSFSGS